MMNSFILTLTDAVTEAAASAAAAAPNAGLTQLPLMTKGLLTTLVGLLGVFLVLALFFTTIKFMQRIRVKEEK